ncbi:MAG: YggT family protein [Candidatus Brocadiia bacterium]|jgi:YggT family protein|nr:YggT family protein [Candidatus Brocadiia bacterium]
MTFVCSFLIAVVKLYRWALVVRLVFSWFPPQARSNRFYEFLRAITEPVLKPFRRLIPPIGGMDFSPIVPLLILMVIGRALT